jgi:hypothetical protein
MGEINDLRNNLQSHWNGLQTQWETTRGSWRDAVSDRFEREFWSFWEEEIPKLLRAMDDLDETLDNALRRTEDP